VPHGEIATCRLRVIRIRAAIHLPRYGRNGGRDLDHCRYPFAAVWVARGRDLDHCRYPVAVGVGGVAAASPRSGPLSAARWARRPPRRAGPDGHDDGLERPSCSEQGSGNSVPRRVAQRAPDPVGSGFKGLLPRRGRANTEGGEARGLRPTRPRCACVLAPRRRHVPSELQRSHALGPIFRTVWWHSIAGTAVIGLIALLQAHVFPGMIPIPPGK